VADSNTLIKIALFGGAGYLAYELFLKPATNAAAASSTPAPGTVAPNLSTAAALPASADVLYQGMVAKATAAGISLTGPDGWNTFVVAAGGPNPMPDPGQVFADRSQNLTAAQYWAVMAPALVKSGGLKGLGIFAGLGMLAGCR
jgi:hypothetical protein